MTPPLFPLISTRLAQKRDENQALGRSWGGFSTKIHAVCDALGNPIRFILTGGWAADYTQAIPLLDGFKTKTILADKGYDADYIVAEIFKMGGKVVIPSKSNCKNSGILTKTSIKSAI